LGVAEGPAVVPEAARRAGHQRPARRRELVQPAARARCGRSQPAAVAARVACVIAEDVLAYRAWGYIRLSLRSTAQPLHARFHIIFSSCFL
jgi:hypothetical protein